MGEAKVGDELTDSRGQARDGSGTTEELDPGAYIGHEPEFEEESIPRGVKPGDERVAAYGSQPGVEGEPDGPAGDRDS